MSLRNCFNVLLCLLAIFSVSCVRAIFYQQNEANLQSPDANRIDASQSSLDSNQGSPDARRIVPGTWVNIAAGTFLMGSASSENCRESNETQHQVTLTHGFEIQTTDVTQAQYESVMGYNPAQFTSCGTNCPVEGVSWFMAVAYCNQLSTYRGYATCYDCQGQGTSISCAIKGSYAAANIYACPGYRLPTEAEFEYASRAGTTTAYYSGTNSTNCTSADTNADLISWNYYNADNQLHPVGQKLPNKWGLYDMSGNLWKWGNDWCDGPPKDLPDDYVSATPVTDPGGPSTGTQRSCRGGSYRTEPTAIRSAFRDNSEPEYRGGDVGFRCVRSR